MDFQGPCPWLMSAVPEGRSIAECGTPLPEEAVARDAQQSDRDGRAPPFSGAKSARLTFPRLRGDLRTLILAGKDSRTVG